ncbi:MAG: hypothetical protein QM758_07050 [Armatimonas sp.]
MRLVTKIMVIAASVTTIAVGVKVQRAWAWYTLGPSPNIQTDKGICTDGGGSTPCAWEPIRQEWLPVACTVKGGVKKILWYLPDPGDSLLGPTVTNYDWVCL